MRWVQQGAAEGMYAWVWFDSVHGHSMSKNNLVE